MTENRQQSVKNKNNKNKKDKLFLISNGLQFENISTNDYYNVADNDDNQQNHIQQPQEQQQKTKKKKQQQYNHNNNNANNNITICVSSGSKRNDVDGVGHDSRIDNTFIAQLIKIIMMLILLLMMMTENCLATTNQQNEIFSNILRQTDSLSTQGPINDLLSHRHHYYYDNASNRQENISQQQQQTIKQQFIESDIKLRMADNSRMATTLSDLDKQVVERLIRQWSPIVWLAPQEKFMPLGVEEFLAHVHPETKSKRMNAAAAATAAHMPAGDISEKAYLVTNADIEELLEDETSFIYGRNPNLSTVPIYAVVTLCPTTNVQQLYATTQATLTPLKVLSTTTKNQYVATVTSTKATSYIPIPLDASKIEQSANSSIVRRASRLYPMFKARAKRQIHVKHDMLTAYNLVMRETVVQSTTINTNSKEKEEIDGVTETNAAIVNNFIANLADNVKFSLPMNNVNEPSEHLDYDQKIKLDKINEQSNSTTPVFHVTFWMFYPYSQGKNMCTLNLGPFGSIPFPTVYGYCLGSNKDIGSHIGDWEHMSLQFNGAAEPESMYVSAHDAGAYYLYNRLTGSFEFKRQETRKGILQRPNFPKTVTTFNDHPVLFAAKGSHGLWTAPGKHRFVKVARLYDINGFGTPWNTWKNVEISYNNLHNRGRSLHPSWLHFKGKWGNPKSKCHPFRFIGLNFCEFSDGPTGIPLKKPHFQCEDIYKS